MEEEALGDIVATGRRRRATARHAEESRQRGEQAEATMEWGVVGRE